MWKPTVKNNVLEARLLSKLVEIQELIESKKDELSPGLINGEAGILLFDNYLNKYLNSSHSIEKIESKILALYENLMEIPSASFSGGISGILWVLDHLNRKGFVEIEPEAFETISLSISNGLVKNSKYGSFDYLHGANGIALYLASRNEEDAHIHFNEWLEMLFEKGEKSNDTICWEVVINSKDGIYGKCLGLAHGIPSVILIMIKILETKPRERAFEILNKSINYLLLNRNPNNMPVYFPNYINKDEIKSSPRPAWCYGDLGCAFALYKAGIYLERAELKNLAIEIMEHHANEIGEKQFKTLIDADFCHGSVGVAHMFARFYNYTGIESMRIASEYYYEKTLDMAYHTDGLAGYKHCQNDGYANDYSLLEGIAGIGLSIISGISDIEPSWDECFLLS